MWTPTTPGHPRGPLELLCSLPLCRRQRAATATGGCSCCRGRPRGGRRGCRAPGRRLQTLPLCFASRCSSESRRRFVCVSSRKRSTSAVLARFLVLLRIIAVVAEGHQARQAQGPLASEPIGLASRCRCREVSATIAATPTEHAGSEDASSQARQVKQLLEWRRTEGTREASEVLSTRGRHPSYMYTKPEKTNGESWSPGVTFQRRCTEGNYVLVLRIYLRTEILKEDGLLSSRSFFRKYILSYAHFQGCLSLRWASAKRKQSASKAQAKCKQSAKQSASKESASTSRFKCLLCFVYRTNAPVLPPRHRRGRTRSRPAGRGPRPRPAPT